ncbi:LysR substrate-binding domain-containing protein [Tahibacter soli]|uniref:LysR substrate-binding domain-containing protein n=1 Tax=Tahibacter soli TaxID=2983605 RepID=A0A9X3YKC2_9GAMM|nr:LysR substrate-binding domain-containing protein [Tahibacter soli]MDC8012775.1 LysR substrate-binding domain-containing protein [Tahibacter soli]
MHDLNDFYLFVQVVDRGGFTAAGEALRIPKSTLSHRMRQLEAGLGVRLLNRSSRRFGTTEAGREFYRHAAAMVRQAEVAETAIRLRSSEPTGLVRFTASLATMQFGIRHMLAAFLERHPKVDLFAHATDRYVDVVGDNYDVAIRAHADPLPDSGLIQRVLAPAPWFLFAGAAYLDRHGVPATPDDLAGRPSLFMVRKGVAPRWRLRHAAGIRPDASVPLSPRVASDDMVSLKQAAIDGCGIVALPGYVCRDTVVAGDLRRILPDWIAGESTLTALLPYREGLLPSVRAFVDHLAAEFPKAVQV